MIAAVLYVPGTTQHEVAKVKEEPVVKEEVITLMQERWFLAESTNPSDQTNPNTLIIQAAYDGDIGTPCPGVSDVCAVRLAIPLDADPSDFENQSVTDALSNGASAPVGGIQYAHQN